MLSTVTKCCRSAFVGRPPTTSKKGFSVTNLRRTGEWTKEPPTKVGWYYESGRGEFDSCIYVHEDGDGKLFILNARALPVIQSHADYMRSKDFFRVQWQKIPVPALPGEGGSE